MQHEDTPSVITTSFVLLRFVRGFGQGGDPSPPCQVFRRAARTLPHPHVPGRASEELGGGRRKGPFPTCARTEWRPCGAATLTRPWYHATPTPASATPASDAATGRAAAPRRSLSPQATRRALRTTAAAMFAEVPAPLQTTTLATFGLARSAASAPPPAPAPWVRSLRLVAVERNTFGCRRARWNW